MVLPVEILAVLSLFAPLFSESVFDHALTLATGAILCRGKRTVSSALRVIGKAEDEHFTNYHRVLNRASWSTLAASKILLGLIISLLPGRAPIVLGADDTIERRKGKKIRHKGVYRDDVRSSKKHVV